MADSSVKGGRPAPTLPGGRGPSVPGPERPFRGLSLFELADPVAEAGGLLVVLLGDRLLQPVAQLHQLRLGLLVLGQAARRLAAVPGLAVDVLQKGEKFLA